MFSEVCVSHSVHRGSLYNVTSCLAAFLRGGWALCLISCSFWGVASLCKSRYLLRGICEGILCERGSLWRSSLSEGEGGLCEGSLWRESLWWGVSVRWRPHGQRSIPLDRDLHPQTETYTSPILTSSSSHWSGRQTSYWNAFLLFLLFLVSSGKISNGVKTKCNDIFLKIRVTCSTLI